MPQYLSIEELYNVLINPKYVDFDGGITLSKYERESLISWIAESGFAPEQIETPSSVTDEED